MLTIHMFNNNNNNKNTRWTPPQYQLNDDMARRNYFNKNMQNPSRHAVNTSQLDREIYVNSSYLKKLYGSSKPEEPHGNYTMMAGNAPMSHREPDLYRDDASILNTYRRRSNSLSSLHHQHHYQYSAMPDFHYPPQNAVPSSTPQVILPSPTTADYLRNRTRESALINVVMKPTRTPDDSEISRILYDDMAYRQLRKDSEAHKFALIKAVNSSANMPNLVNITTLPIHSQRPSGYESPVGVNKTVKMIKQKDAINKRFSNSNTSNYTYGDTRSGHNNYVEHANR